MHSGQLRRREFISLLGGVAAAWPAAARAQRPAMPVIGFLTILSADQDQGRAHAFRQGLAEAGFVDGRDVTIDYRWAAGGQPKLVAVSAEELVRRQVSVIVAGSDTAALAAKAATNT